MLQRTPRANTLIVALLLKNCSLLQLLQQYLFRYKCDSALCFEVSFSVLVSKHVFCLENVHCTDPSERMRGNVNSERERET